jgi:2-polyprenyl-6-methoxyphenol hydroxylase-like FAD-dependent oxidoreductase
MKAIVSGAGIAGLSTALALSRRGWEVLVLERARGLRARGYMIDFFGPGYEAAERLEVLPALKAAAHQVDEVEFVDGEGRRGAAVNYRLAARAVNGKLLALLRGDIERVLYDAVRERVTLRYGTELTAIDNRPGAVSVILSDGSTETADLLVGADGIHSHTRALLFGPEAPYLRFLSHQTAAYIFEDETIRRALGGSFKLLAVPGRQVGLYDTGNGRLAAFFVHRTGEAALPADPAARLRDVYGDLGWMVPRALAAMPPADEIYYDLVAQVVLDRWHAGRTVLVGDAAYAVSLLAGQGASLGIAGPETLAAELAAGGGIEAALTRWETRLRPLIAQKQEAGRRTADWFIPSTPFRLWVRNAVLNTTNWPPLSGLLGRFVGVSTKGFAAKESAVPRPRGSTGSP